MLHSIWKNYEINYFEPFFLKDTIILSLFLSSPKPDISEKDSTLVTVSQLHLWSPTAVSGSLMAVCVEDEDMAMVNSKPLLCILRSLLLIVCIENATCPSYVSRPTVFKLNLLSPI